jgi:membrane protease subunit (stomatin/prohibitin family)
MLSSYATLKDVAKFRNLGENCCGAEVLSSTNKSSIRAHGMGMGMGMDMDMDMDVHMDVHMHMHMHMHIHAHPVTVTFTFTCTSNSQQKHGICNVTNQQRNAAAKPQDKRT